MENVRLFLGIGLDAPLSNELYKQTLKLMRSSNLHSCKLVPLENYHLTLAFLGQRPKSDIDDLTHSLSNLGKATPFQEITLDRIDCFPHPSGRLLAAQATPNQALLALHKECCKIANIEPDFDFKPHITLIRKLPKPHQLPTPNHLKSILSAKAINLYLSHPGPTGVQYSLLHSASLKACKHL